MNPTPNQQSAAAALIGVGVVALNKKLGLELTVTDVLTIGGLLGSFIAQHWHRQIKAMGAEPAKP